MTYNQFIKIIEKYYHKINLKQINPAPVIHEGFPGNFNLSLTEYEFLNQNPNFFDLKNDMVYSKIQPCIRYNDYVHIKKRDKDAYRYLLRFSMAPVGGIYWLKNNLLY